MAIQEEDKQENTGFGRPGRVDQNFDPTQPPASASSAQAGSENVRAGTVNDPDKDARPLNNIRDPNDIAESELAKLMQGDDESKKEESKGAEIDTPKEPSLEEMFKDWKDMLRPGAINSLGGLKKFAALTKAIQDKIEGMETIDAEAKQIVEKFGAMSEGVAGGISPRLNMLTTFANGNTDVAGKVLDEISILEDLKVGLQKSSEIVQGAQSKFSEQRTEGQNDQAATANQDNADAGGNDAEADKEKNRGLGEEQDLEQERSNELAAQQELRRQFEQQAQISGISRERAQEIFAEKSESLAGQINPAVEIQNIIRAEQTQVANLQAQQHMHDHQSTIAKKNGMKVPEGATPGQLAAALSAVNGMKLAGNITDYGTGQTQTVNSTSTPDAPSIGQDVSMERFT